MQSLPVASGLWIYKNVALMVNRIENLCVKRIFSKWICCLLVIFTMMITPTSHVHDIHQQSLTFTQFNINYNVRSMNRHQRATNWWISLMYVTYLQMLSPLLISFFFVSGILRVYYQHLSRRWFYEWCFSKRLVVIFRDGCVYFVCMPKIKNK